MSRRHRRKAFAIVLVMGVLAIITVVTLYSNRRLWLLDRQLDQLDHHLQQQRASWAP